MWFTADNLAVLALALLATAFYFANRRTPLELKYKAIQKQQEYNRKYR